jgi:hypothetical protein
MTRPLALLALSLLMAGCPRPPDAPETLDELCSYLFEHQPDETDEALAAGLSNLDLWLDDHWDETGDGFVVSGISAQTADGLDGTDRSVEGILGSAVATRADHALDAALAAMLTVDQDVVAPDSYGHYERDYLTDVDCFLDDSCSRLETEEWFEALLPLNVTSDNHAYNQYISVEFDGGAAVIQRAWLVEPPTVNLSWLEVDEQYYLNVAMDHGDGYQRLQTTWMVNSQDNLPEDTVLYMVAQGMITNAEYLDVYLEGA